MKKLSVRIMLCLISMSLYAADGDLDPSFGGGDGVVQAPAGQQVGKGQTVYIQTDGKIVLLSTVVGFTFNQLIRYNSDGSLDASFGGTGIVTIPTPNAPYQSLIIQSDGKIVVAGFDETFSFFQLTRYNSDGTLDTSFGTAGFATGSIGGAFAVLIQPDSKIVAAGANFEAGLFKVVRFNADGTVDTTFQAGPTGVAQSVVMQADGKILAAGQDVFGFMQLVRYNIDGTLDLTYGVGGIATGPASFGLNMAVIQPDGNVVVAATNAANNNFQIARFTTAGLLDPAFGVGGVFVGPAGFAVSDIVLQADMKSVVVGQSLVGSFWRLVRYITAGAIDATFGTLGIVDNPVGRDLQGMALQQDGKIVVGGAVPGDLNQVARYLNSPILTPTQILVPANGASVPAGALIISGTAQNPSTVFIFIDDVLVGGVTTDPLGTDTWTFTTTITSGAHTLQAISLYKDGNVNLVSDIINIGGILPPTDFTGTITSNTFLNIKECLLLATFSPSTSTTVVSYQVFRNGVLLATIPASSPLVFELCSAIARCADCCTNPVFSNITLVAVDNTGATSTPIALEIVCS